MTRQRSRHAPAIFCPVRDVLAGLLDRWCLLVLFHLAREGRTRFSALEGAIPDVSPRMLSLRLQELQAAGVVARFVFGEVPPRIEYKLTPSGLALVDALKGVEAWALEQQVRERGPAGR